ncbi:(-)-isopiperitenol/(-)-carveol dehydrogenase, mitochondrial-like [Euphorbia lathyris]|uniref:(-)-isopiperitenol/(-)-carveol dehydrogenase, mitochondrial-like n=1 Tax=Euphorbia lathyris TaxID=212925 RepID=UPI0033131E15
MDKRFSMKPTKTTISNHANSLLQEIIKTRQDIPSRTPNKKLSGKVAIITGGTSGIGEATACLFADHSALIVVIADIQDELGQQVANSIGANRCMYLHCDVTKEEQVKFLVEWTLQNYGHLDIMFSNAGTTTNSEQTILNLDLSAYDNLMSVNARGMATCVKYAARAIVDGHMRGSIMCTSSVAGRIRSDKWVDYTMSKHAVVGLVKSASRQLGVHGIRVNFVSPYSVVTPMTINFYAGKSEEATESSYESKMNLKGVVLKTKNIGDVVVFLCCDDSQLITGHAFMVDGGFLT